MNTSRNRLPMIASTCALLTVAAAWGATVASRPWDIALIIIAIIGISLTIGMIGRWVMRMKAEADASDEM